MKGPHKGLVSRMQGTSVGWGFQESFRCSGLSWQGDFSPLPFSLESEGGVWRCCSHPEAGHSEMSRKGESIPKTICLQALLFSVLFHQPATLIVCAHTLMTLTWIYYVLTLYQTLQKTKALHSQPLACAAFSLIRETWGQRGGTSLSIK